jgi:AcrR family transcriptional regulator
MTCSDEPKPITRAKTARRDRILDAAESLFAQVGLRSATMEAIAAVSSVSKATLYAYFPDKMAVFSAVASRLASDMQSGVITALEEKGSLVDRVSNALMAKHGRAFDAAIGSPHALELLDTRRHEFGQLFNAMDRAIEDAIFRALQAAGCSAPRDDARLIFCASIGISEQAKSRGELEMDLRRLVSAILPAYRDF